MTIAARQEREKAERAERIRRGEELLKAERERLNRQGRQGRQEDGAAEPKRANAPADREPTRAAPSSFSPADYTLTFGKFRGATLREVAGLAEREGADYLDWLRGALRETLAALELYLTSEACLDPDDDDPDDDDPDDDLVEGVLHRPRFYCDRNAPLCVRQRAGEENAR